MNITILGAGTWGVALARVLSLNSHQVMVWSKFPEEAEKLDRTREAVNLPGIRIPEGIRFTADASEAVDGAEFILTVVPSVFMRETIRTIAPFAGQRKVIWVNASKGIESGTLMVMTEVIEDELRKAGITGSAVTAISGPTHAEEVARDMPTLIVAAGKKKHADAVQKLFEGTCIRPYTNSDIRGVQICGALKNVEALAVGIAKGLGYGDNTCAAMMTRGMEEIRRLGLQMGCRERTFFGLAGIGDLIVTATSNHSRNNRCGMMIGQGMSAEDAVKKVGMVVEGINALPAAVKLCEKYGMEMPLIEAVRDVVQNHADPGQIVFDLMSRKLKQESV